MFGGIGVPELLIAGILAFPLTLGVLFFWVGFARRAKRFGYPGVRAYLRAAPHTDEEKRDAADLTLKGVVCCLLGLMFPPLILAGLFPLFYGLRKFLYASMGLGLIDDPDQSEA